MGRFVPGLVALLVAALVAIYFWPRRVTPAAESAPSVRAPAVAPPTSAAPTAAPPRVLQPGWEAEFPLAAPLNAPESTIARDLETLSAIFDAWRTNFPREGNPVGENADITAVLTGANRLGLALIPAGHRAINGAGELCDRWGTPLRFHQLSGERMEIRSAGPDGKFATDDDAFWTPP